MHIGDFSKNTKQRNCCVGIDGGGIAGSTVALRLAELGVRVLLFEQGASLVSGPPMCHLHAGGNFYREISDQQCLALLR
jgi:flavin-dependent dehydrogenase